MVVADGAVPDLSEGAVVLYAIADVDALLAVLDLAVDVRVLEDGGIVALGEDKGGAVLGALGREAEVGEGSGRDGVGGPLLQRMLAFILHPSTQVVAPGMQHSRPRPGEGGRRERTRRSLLVVGGGEERSLRRRDGVSYRRRWSERVEEKSVVGTLGVSRWRDG